MKFGRRVVAVVWAMTKWGRVGVVFSRLRRKSLKRPHEVTSALSDSRLKGCTTTIGENKKGNM